jgi:hypothetical protein
MTPYSRGIATTKFRIEREAQEQGLKMRGSKLEGLAILLLI